MELSQRSQTAVQIVLKPPAPRNGGPIYRFWASGSCGRLTGWLVLLLIKAGDVESNPGPTITHKQVWICNICHKQIHGRKQISIRCNRIEHSIIDISRIDPFCYPCDMLQYPVYALLCTQFKAPISKKSFF